MLPGLEPFAAAELGALGGVSAVRQESGALSFRFVGDAAHLAGLRTVVAVYRLLHFAVPRPKALLGHEHLTRLTGALSEVQHGGTFEGFRLSAAGGESAVFSRLSEVLAAQTGLTRHAEGELLVRVRRAPNGWEVLLRLTPRPLSARAWRVCNLGGGLNATVAAAMLELAAPGPHARLFNPMCGSGTLLIEAGERMRWAGRRPAPGQLRGCDLSPAALSCSAQNVTAAGLTHVDLFRGDATHTGLEAGSVDVIVADPPWGDALGSHTANAVLYPSLLLEAARIAAPGGRLLLLSHELRLLERVLRAQRAWKVAKQLQVFHGGHHPRIYLLEGP